MKRKGIVFLIACLLMVVNSCSVQKAVNMVNCDYSFQSISSVEWAGIDFMKVGSDFKNLDPSTIVSCITALTRKDFALRAVANVKATNPGKRDAALAGFDYILYYDGKQVGSGESANQSDIVVRSGGGSTIIPVGFKLELGNVVDIKQPKESVQNVIGIIKDVTKLGKEDTRFSVKIRPHIRTGNKVVNGTYFNLKKI